MEINDNYFYKNKKTVLVVFIITGLLVLFSIIIGLVGTSTLIINSDTEYTVFTVNGKQYVNVERVKNLRPGKYTVVLTDSRFIEEKYVVDLGLFNTKEVSFNNAPASEEAATDPEAGLKDYFNKSSKTVELDLGQIENKYPITKLLPYFSGSFVFDYDASNIDNVVFYVEAQPSSVYNKESAKIVIEKFLKDNKIEIKNISIDYR